MIADMSNSKKLNPLVTELFIRGIKLNISVVFKSYFKLSLTQSYFKVPKDIRLNSTHLGSSGIPLSFHTSTSPFRSVWLNS